MTKSDASDQASAQQHASFLRAVLAVNSRDQHPNKSVLPSASMPEGGAPESEIPTSVTLRTRRLLWRLRPPVPR